LLLWLSLDRLITIQAKGTGGVSDAANAGLPDGQTAYELSFFRQGAAPGNNFPAASAALAQISRHCGFLAVSARSFRIPLRVS
jgi:hypothetical protein